MGPDTQKLASPQPVQDPGASRPTLQQRWYNPQHLSDLIDEDFGPPETRPKWSRSYAYEWNDMSMVMAPSPVVTSQARNAEEFEAEMRSKQRNVLEYTNKGPGKYRADLAKKCQEFYQAAQDKENHVSKLDAVLSGLLFCKYHPEKILRLQLEQHIDSLLCRQPCTVIPLPDAMPSEIDTSYFYGQGHGWDDLQVTASLQKNLVRNIACIVISRSEKNMNLNDFNRNFTVGDSRLVKWDLLTTIGEILDVMASHQKTPSFDERHDLENWFVARAFLWTHWQRMRLLQLLFISAFASVTHGKGDGSSVTTPRNFQLSPKASMAAHCRTQAVEQRPERMCGWALQLLQGSPGCCGLDFRLLYQRYTSALGNTASRCQKASTFTTISGHLGRLDTNDPMNEQTSAVKQKSIACDGRSPESCLRYKGLEVPDQSAHDQGCRYHENTWLVEAKIVWSQSSYERVQGPKAISIDTYDDEHGMTLQYCAASERTLAISHVWIHGQGGRPETGINQCLHRRYAQIARNNACDSYWMDTTCIPTDHDLRKEAIAQINGVFTRCAAALVCDKDLMQLDISHMNTIRREEILAAVLLCDWNVRAWTLLESVKARGKILLLCKDNRVVQLDELIQDVCNSGCLGMAVFFHQLPHMLPLDPMYSNVSTSTSIEVMASWLSCRPAGRENDAITIWSLLIIGEDVKPSYDAVSFWRSQMNLNIRTGCLLTSSPRLKTSGLRWAPVTPYAPPEQTSINSTAEMHRLSPSEDTAIVTIRRNGIWGSWYIHRFGFRLHDFYRLESIICPIERELVKIRRTHLWGYRFGALLRPEESMPSWAITSLTERSDYFTPRTDGSGVLLVVCGSNMWRSAWEPDAISARVLVRPADPSVCWTWRAVYKWPIEDVPLPPTWTLDQHIWIS